VPFYSSFFSPSFFSSSCEILNPRALYRYCASKWALEGWSDSIRREFRLWGIKVRPHITINKIVCLLKQA
jgi:hypothetical protein